MFKHRLAVLLPLVVGACAPDTIGTPVPETGLYDSLPFELTRPAVGEPPSAAEIETFTRKLTGFWNDIDYFRWCTWHSHGLHASYDPTMPPYGLWWQDTLADKSGDTVTFRHHGGADNLMIRTSKVLGTAIAGYLATGDPMMRQIVIDYSRGTVALFKGLSFEGEDPPAPYVTARAIFSHNHSYTTEDGRNVAVDYDPVKVENYDWNAHTVQNQNNPTYGDIWVRNMRSKDDLPHMWRLPPLLERLIRDSDDPEVTAAAQEALEYLRGMGKDIVDQGYLIRTKEADEVFVPCEEDNPDLPKDLASFVRFDDIVPNGECNGKFTAALLGHGEPLGNDCGNGIQEDFEAVAFTIHYFNRAIIRYFHLAAITNALTLRKDDLALELLRGLIRRADDITADTTERLDNPEWDADSASFLAASAASGLPLTAEEARIIMDNFGLAVDLYQAWSHWDLWDGAVADGTYSYKPSRADLGIDRVRIEEMTYLIEYCYSPWKNPAGAELIDCAVVLDRSRWGQ